MREMADLFFLIPTAVRVEGMICLFGMGQTDILFAE